MSDSYDPLEGYNDMNEMEQVAAEQRILDKAFRNSYLIITGKSSFEDIIDQSGGIIIAHNYVDGPDTPDLENMMDYFIETEEYEKCSYIRDYIKEIKTNDDRKQEEDSSKGISKILTNIIRRAEESEGSDTPPSI
jgi:hypothetical protein